MPPVAPMPALHLFFEAHADGQGTGRPGGEDPQIIASCIILQYVAVALGMREGEFLVDGPAGEQPGLEGERCGGPPACGIFTGAWSGAANAWQSVCIIAVFTTAVPIKEIRARTASGPPAAASGPPPRVPWSTAARATLHCLTGCAIGEILGMVIGTAASLPNIATVVLAVALAFVFGYALTARGLLRAGVSLRAALRAALAADTVSIMVMELTDNTVIAAIPGAMDAGLGTALFWATLTFSLIVAFVATVPLNRWLIGRGQGHALLHTHHH